MNAQLLGDFLVSLGRMLQATGGDVNLGQVLAGVDVPEALPTAVEPAATETAADLFNLSPTPAAPAEKRGRGRPRKNPAPEAPAQQAPAAPPQTPPTQVPATPQATGPVPALDTVRDSLRALISLGGTGKTKCFEILAEYGVKDVSSLPETARQAVIDKAGKAAAAIEAEKDALA